MAFDDLGYRAGSTLSTRRVTHRLLDIRYKDKIHGEVVENEEGPGPGFGEMVWWPVGYIESWSVPLGVTELLVSGMGGSRAVIGGVPNDAFGTFKIPVTPGALLDIMVGTGYADELDPVVPGWPDGGYGNYASGYGTTSGGGSGGTFLKDGGTTLFVAPGVGGDVPAVPGQFGSDRFVWTAYGQPASAFIGSDAGSWAWSDPEVLPGSVSDGLGGFYVVDAQNPGGAGGSTAGGGGADPTAGYTFSRPGGGGGGGGWGKGAGGTCVAHHLEPLGSDAQSFAHTSWYGSSGQPHAHASATYEGDPFDQMLNFTPLITPHLYVRWEIPA